MENLIIDRLFLALDDIVRKEYYAYLQDGGEYPSELAVKALLDGQDKLGLPSVALREMDKNLAKNILRSL